MPTRLRGTVLSSSDLRSPVSGIHVEAYDPGTGFAQGDATTDANGNFTISGLEDRTWVPRRLSGSTSINIQLVKENWVEDEPHAQRTTLSAHGFGEIRGNLGADKGGTGVGSPASGAILIGGGAAATAMTVLAPGAAGGFVRSDGSAWVRNTIQSSDLPSGFTGFSTPAASSITISAPTAGTATTAIRTDATLQLSQAIAPTWTGPHTFKPSATVPSDAIFLSIDQPASGPSYRSSHNVVWRSTGNEGGGYDIDWRWRAATKAFYPDSAFYMEINDNSGSGWQEAMRMDYVGSSFSIVVSSVTTPAVAYNGPMTVGGTTTLISANSVSTGITLQNTNTSGAILALKSGATVRLTVSNAGLVTFNGGISLDVNGISTDTTTGTKIGTGTTQKLGFWNATPVAQNTGWGSITNVTTDRAYDANATSLDEISDVLGTLIATLVNYGILGA